MPWTVPRKPSIGATLDTVANIAIIIVCAIAAFILIRNHFFNPNQAGGPRPPEIKAGETYAALGQLVPSGAERALVVAVSPTCHFCEESMPFYKRLVDERNQKGSNVKVIAAVPREEAKAEEAQKMAAAGVTPDGVAVLDFNTVKVLDPADCPGLIYYIPTPKSPHGVDVDPTGEYIVAGGKLATVIPVHSYTKMIAAIDSTHSVVQLA